MTASITRSIEIAAPADDVWAVLEDHASYPEWNPFMVRMQGDWRVGERLEVDLRSGTGKPMTFKPVVEVADRARRLRWLGHLWVRGLFDGRHELDLEPVGDACTRFTQSESFTGILVGPLRGVIDDAVVGFEAMNRALKERVERDVG